MYRPPQMIDMYLKYPVDDRVDIWMLGCVLYALNYGRHPFQDDGKLSIVNAAVRYQPTASKKMQYLMRNMLTPNPHFRPRAADVIELIDKWESIEEIELNKVATIILKN